MARVMIGLSCYTELEVVQLVNNLKKQNTELRDLNRALNKSVDRLDETARIWRNKHLTLKERVINLTKGLINNET